MALLSRIPSTGRRARAGARADAARRLGIEIPPTVLARADEVIRIIAHFPAVIAMPLSANYAFNPTTRKSAAHRLMRPSDGDTLVVEQPIRMVSCDTPEKAQYAGAPPTAQPKLNLCRQRLQNGFYGALPADLRNYLIGKLTADAAQRHIAAAVDAFAHFDTIVDTRLTRPDGEKRQVAVLPSGEIIDSYGRMLAYLAPWFAGTAADPLPPAGSPERRTFNLDMIADGWAAFFAIYPSLPRLPDMRAAVAAAERAWDDKLGAWDEYGEDLLLGYEYRMCIKLAQADDAAEGLAKAFERVCVDLRTLRIVGKHGFPAVPPSLRLWVWEDDLAEARAALGLQG
jgi:endonuclease YncB( thermonuclease family)